MSALKAPDEDELAAAEKNPVLKKLAEAMGRRVPSEEDRKLLLAFGRAVQQLCEERGMTPAELACEPDGPTPADGRLDIEAEVLVSQPEMTKRSSAEQRDYGLPGDSCPAGR